ncbi:MAG: NADH-quinone oxidoreductase subunit L [Fimbriimonadales bacterium]|nr:MAG: NADH-quinone oxidoreductase subunit 12 [Fimbriimonadales bacterium]
MEGLRSDTILWVLALPLAGSLFHALLGGWLVRTLGERTGKWLIGAVGTGVALGAFAFGWQLFQAMLALPEEARRTTYLLTDWIRVGDLRVPIEFVLDPLSILMTLIVTGVGGLIHLYATGYMAEDEDYPRFFTYFNLFIFFMLVLVLAGNFLVMFVGWEGVGLCSYLLIGFFYRNAEWKSNTDAANKAFIVNRIGDAGYLLAMFLVFALFGTLSFAQVNAQALPVLREASLAATAIALLLFLAAAGKSAQLPLYFWLPDAMAGPTPVSALIHAATMVTAGVYLLVRVHPLLEMAPMAMGIVAGVGALTALFAATIAIAQTDLKRVLAYSTVSQLGYMFLACGVGAFWAGMFHVATHAFFKALLFLGAGSVLIALHHQGDIRAMGGLARALPITAATMLVGWLAIAGIPPLSGFWSKEAVLLSVYNAKLVTFAPVLFGVGILTAGLTAAYMTRMVWLVFFAPPAHQEHHAPVRERYATVLSVLGLLALGSVLFGWLLPSEKAFHEFLKPVAEPSILTQEQLFFSEAAGKGLVFGIALGAAVLGILFGVARYRRGVPEPEARLAGVWGAAHKQWGYDGVMRAVGVNLGGAFALVLSVIVESLIDLVVNAVGALARSVGNWLRPLQSGYVRSYAFVMMLGALLLLAAAFVYGLR